MYVYYYYKPQLMMRSAGLQNLFLAEAHKNLIMWMRYPLQPIVGLVTVLGFFVALSLGLKKLPSLDVFSNQDQRVVVASFFCWIAAMGAVAHISAELEEDLKLGVFEPIFLSRHRASLVILTRSLAGSVSGLALGFLALSLMSWYSDAKLQIGLSSGLALILLDFTLSGIGLVMAGVSILFKRASSLSSIISLGFGVLIASEVSLRPSNENIKYPVRSAVELFCRTLFGQENSLREVSVTIAWALATVIIGAALLEWCVAIARRRGSLSHC